jgi:hypothetical protein
MHLPVRTATLGIIAVIAALLCLLIVVVGPTGSADAAVRIHPVAAHALSSTARTAALILRSATLNLR